MATAERPAGPAARTPPVRTRFEISGLVQGVGMRPFVARLAQQLGLSGSCRNTPTNVVVEVEGGAAAVAQFGRRLTRDAPPLARFDEIRESDVPPQGGAQFVIDTSGTDTGPLTLCAPDTAPCEDCLREFADPADRRYRHPFITCTNCGPRYTITVDLPYDRPSTTLADFPLCPACAAEYADPADRRYHAQPIGCHDCGPRLALADATRTPLADGLEAVVAGAQRALVDGAVLAVKGLGGYHLACDAGSAPAVARLRSRKHRPDQPFAVMAADLDVAARLAGLTDEATRQLTGAARPIVLLPRAESSAELVCAEVAPRLDELGVMLPYTPVHHLLFADPSVPRVLVMTSGNRSGEPLCVADDDAFARLAGIADVWLTHDRPIAVACEDSVVALDAAGRPVPIRRSRGFAPLPVRLSTAAAGSPPDPEPFGHPVVLAVGADLKNTFTLVRDGQAFVSAHIGDLGTLESQQVFRQAVDQAQRFHRSGPGLVVADRHPSYASRTEALRRSDAAQVPLVEAQHHHAHLASLAAEHRRIGQPLLGLVFDGTGYGCDATIWGGELLRLGADPTRCDRLGHLATLPLPGGDAGVRNPVRLAAAASAVAELDVDGTPVADGLTDAERALVPSLVRSWSTGAGAGWVPTSSVGRLFDVVSSVLGVCHRVSYEAQAAIEVQVWAARWAATQPDHPDEADDQGSHPRVLTGIPIVDDTDGQPVWDWRPLLRDLLAAVRRGEDRGRLAWEFHVGLADAAAALAARVLPQDAEPTVGLTGGVFQNRLLTELTTAALRRRGITALTHRLVPANDGGISLGQAVIGLAAARGERTSPLVGTGAG